MKTFNAKSFDGKIVVLSNSTELTELFNTIENNEDFILEWTEDKKQKAELIIANNVVGKIKTGDIKLISEEE